VSNRGGVICPRAIATAATGRCGAAGVKHIAALSVWGGVVVTAAAPDNDERTGEGQEGGIATNDNQPMTITPSGLIMLVRHGFCPPQISDADILDKSKFESLGKAVVCLQVVWVAAQLIGRLAANLPLCLLELNTIGHIMHAAATYVLWWNKPLDIMHPAVVIYNVDALALLAELPTTSLKDKQGYETAQLSKSYVPLDTVSSLPTDSSSSSADEADHAHEQWEEPYLLPGSISNWPKTTLSNDPRIMAFLSVGAIVCGSIHVAAWHAHFPSVPEWYMWQCASIFAVSVGVVGFLYYFPSAFAQVTLDKIPPVNRKCSWRNSIEGLFPEGTQGVLKLLFLCLYTISRVFLVVEAFIAVRSLPRKSYQMPDWVMLFPHL
jgi:hypothetical protein